METNLESAQKMIEGIAPQPNDKVFKPTEGMSVGEGMAHVKDGVIFNAIGLESTADHKHVAKVWQEKCTPILDFADKIKKNHEGKVDERKPWSYLTLDSSLRLPDGRGFTKHGLASLVQMTPYPQASVDYHINEDDNNTAEIARCLNKDLIARHEKWVESKNSRVTSKFADQDEKDVLVRIRPELNSDESVVRYVGSSIYGVINNVDVMDMIIDGFKASPYGGDISKALASHTFDNLDVMHGNILIPDMMKAYPDSDYGVGLAFANSEIGTYNMKVSPFLFRAICYNGCIWGKQESVIISKKHLGAINMDEIRKEVYKNIILALTEGNDLLVQMDYSRESVVPMDLVPKVITYLADSNPKITVAMAKAWFNDFKVEPIESGFGVVNGLTRAAQRYDGDDRWLMESTAGSILTPSLTASKEAQNLHWAKIVDRASDVSEKKVRKYTSVEIEA